MFESLASCFASLYSASLNSPQDESAVADMTRQWLLELRIWNFQTTQGLACDLNIGASNFFGYWSFGFEISG